MANASETLKVQVHAATCVFTRTQVEQWREGNPGGTLDDFIEDCKRQETAAKARLIEVEIENGSTREEAERMARLMR